MFNWFYKHWTWRIHLSTSKSSQHLHSLWIDLILLVRVIYVNPLLPCMFLSNILLVLLQPLVQMDARKLLGNLTKLLGVEGGGLWWTITRGSSLGCVMPWKLEEALAVLAFAALCRLYPPLVFKLFFSTMDSSLIIQHKIFSLIYGIPSFGKRCFISVFQGFCSGWALRGYDLSDVKERFPHFLYHLHDFCHWIFTRWVMLSIVVCLPDFKIRLFTTQRK